MAAKILTFQRSVNGIFVEQRVDDGFINATAMCVAHGKNVADWFRTQDGIDTVVALAQDLGIQPNYGKSHNSVVERIPAIYPSLVIVKRGSPENGGGTWVHPDLAIYLAQWCNKPFAIQVSRWVREWLMTGQNPIESNVDRQFVEWQQRYDLRMYLKDFLRPELMASVIQWAEQHGVSPITLCSEVHDTMNERIQGAKSQQIRLMGGLPLGVLIRDYFEASPLVGYCAINKSAKNMISDHGMHPVDAVHKSCDYYLGKSYIPKLAPIAENVHAQGRRLRSARRQRQLDAGIQLNFSFSDSQAS